MSDAKGRPLIALAERLIVLPPTDRRAARLLIQGERLQLRLKARQFAGVARLFDGMAKFGGGSLFTAVLLLILGGKLETGTIIVAAATLAALLGGTTLAFYFERQTARFEIAAERLDALLKETER